MIESFIHINQIAYFFLYIVWMDRLIVKHFLHYIFYTMAWDIKYLIVHMLAKIQGPMIKFQTHNRFRVIG